MKLMRGYCNLMIKGKPTLKEISKENLDKGFELNFGVFIRSDARKYEGIGENTNNMEKVIIKTAKEKVRRIQWENGKDKIK